MRGSLKLKASERRERLTALTLERHVELTLPRNQQFPAEVMVTASHEAGSVWFKACATLKGEEDLASGIYSGTVEVNDPRYEPYTLEIAIEVKDRRWYWALMSSLIGGISGTLWGVFSARRTIDAVDLKAQRSDKTDLLMLDQVLIALVAGAVFGFGVYGNQYLSSGSFDGRYLTQIKLLGAAAAGGVALYTVVSTIQGPLRPLLRSLYRLLKIP